MIKIENAKKTFGDLIIYDKLNLYINKPGLYFIKGSSGSGKSTFLNLLAGFDQFDSGIIKVDKNIATIFQNYELIDDLNVEENIFLEINPDIMDHKYLLEELGISNLLKNYPNELSGGQRQRVGIARALLLNPNIILCDEPTESLDIENKIIVMDLLKRMSKNKIVIVASHDLLMANKYADHVFYIKNKELISKEEYSSDEKLIYSNKKEFSFQQISKLVKKILIKRTILLSLIILLLSCSLQLLYLYERKLFYVPSSKQVLNADMVYFETMSVNEKYKTNQYESILKIEETLFMDNEYQFNVYPFVENTKGLKIVGEEPINNGIIINQNVLKELDLIEWENTTLKFIYFLGALEHELNCTVVGIVYEEDTNLKNVYYNLNDVLNILAEKEYEVGWTHKNYLEEYGKNFQKKVGYNAISEIYLECANRSDVFLRSPLYDERENMLSGFEIFLLAFKIIRISLFLIIVLFVLVTMNYESNSYMKTCAILSSQGIDLLTLKKLFIKEKTVYFFPSLIFITFIIIYIGFSQLSEALKINDYFTIILILVAIIGVYQIVLVKTIRKLQVEKISQILKNDN